MGITISIFHINTMDPKLSLNSNIDLACGITTLKLWKHPSKLNDHYPDPKTKVMIALIMETLESNPIIQTNIKWETNTKT